LIGLCVPSHIAWSGEASGELPAIPDPSPPLDSSGDEDPELVEICTVWSLADALQLQTLLDRAGIPFFMGPEKATAMEILVLLSTPA